MSPSHLSRRRFLHLGATWLGATALADAAQSRRHVPIPDFVGINAASFTRQNRTTDPTQRIDPYDLPRLMRDELDLRVIDMVSTVLNTREHAPLEKYRAEADRAGCIITNLKVNLADLRFDSADEVIRRHSIDEYKRWIEAAAVLGARWIRPFPAATAPHWEPLIDGYKELAEHAETFGITLLIENYRWLDRDPDMIPRIVKALGGRVAAQPDTFNWIDHPTRLAGLARTFPLAASCDFKVRDLGPNHEHAAYDLRACFELGRAAGFRGPWCIEHLAADKTVLLREMKWIAGQLRSWTVEPAVR